MANKLIRQVTRVYVPGIPAVPPTPERCYTRTITVPRTGSVGGSQASGNFIAADDIPFDETNSGVGYSGFLTPVYGPNIDPVTGKRVVVGYQAMRFSPDRTQQPSYTTRTETVCTPGSPGVEGVPAEIILKNAGPDWRASARSIGTRQNNVAAGFDVNPSPRMIVGFAPLDTGSNQSDIRMGVAFVTTGVTTTVSPVLDGVVQSSVGTYTAGQRITLARVSGRFHIQLAGATVFSADATTEEEVFLDAMLYTDSDYVDNPTLVAAEPSSINASTGFVAGLSTATGAAGAVGFRSTIGTAVDGLLLVQVTGSVGFAGAPAGVATQQIGVIGSVGFNAAIKSGVSSPGESTPGFNSASMSIGPVEALGSNAPYAAASVDLLPLVVDASGGELSQSASGSDIVIAPMPVYGTMLSGGLGQVEVDLKPLSLFASEGEYAEGQFVLPRLFTYGDDGFGIPNYYGHNDSLRISDTMFTDPSLFASIYDTLEVEPSMSLGVLVSGSILEALILDPTLSVKDFLYALIESGINLSSATQLPDPTVAQYAFNALTGAATRYSDFGFTQFTRVGGETYAVKPDGLYRLRRGDDNGSRRSALVDFGTLSFGAQQRKNIETLYLGMSTDGTVYAKLKADGGNEKVYRVIQREPTMRVRTGKGITAREWNLKLEVVDATRVDLDNVDFVVGASVRRWTR